MIKDKGSFNPGFDRKKAELMDLINSGNGLDPVYYLYAVNSGFNSISSSNIKGGFCNFYDVVAKQINVDLLEAALIIADKAVVTEIEATTVNVDTVSAKTINVDKINSQNIDNSLLISTRSLDAHLVTAKEILSGSIDGGSVYALILRAEAMGHGVIVPFLGKSVAPGFYTGYGSMDVMGNVTIRPSSFTDIFVDNSFKCETNVLTSFQSNLFTSHSKLETLITSDMSIEIESPLFTYGIPNFTAIRATDLEFKVQTGDFIDIGTVQNLKLHTTFNSIELNEGGIKIDPGVQFEVNGLSIFRGNIVCDENITAVKKVVGTEAIQFGEIAFRSESAGAYFWPAPPIVVVPVPSPFPEIETFVGPYLSCEPGESGILVWSSELVIAESELPAFFSYLSCNEGGTGELYWTETIVPPAIPLDPIPQEYVVGPYLTCDGETGNLRWVSTIVTKYLPPVPAGEDKRQRIVRKKDICHGVFSGDKITINDKQYNIPKIK